ncbi:Symplekin [Toxocara canis]|uniref:Symplekin n=1 Tax=Toxocara canis TaxID=6265 RepID=A0A0B2VLY2_TOXCA|nr:Symplekin [Toxocara canis]
MVERGSQDLSEEIGSEIHEALQMSGKTVEERIVHLQRAQEMLLNRDKSGSLLDNFLDEMLEFVVENDSKVRCFVASFIEKACKKDAEVMKKAVVSLSYMMELGSSGSVSVTKKVIGVCSQVYPYVLKWAASSRNAEVERCWEAFSVLKGRIMQQIDSDNEGIRTQALKFLEAVVLAQTLRTEESEKGRGDHMCLNEIGRDHRFISYRKMESEANLNFNSLLDQTSSAHISSLNLLTCLSSICNIAHQRPQFMHRVIGALESLHVNLPPTLATSQVKSVRKELKMHLLRLLRHPSSAPFHQRITTLLTDLGAGQSEVLRALPATSEIRKRPQRQEEAAEERDRKRSKTVVEDETSKVVDKEEDEEYGDEGDGPTASAEAVSSQSAIDVTAQFVFERLSPRVVTNLVLISLVTLPDEMPAAFQSSYTPIAAAGTESQIRHLSRMIATQLTSLELGPGVEMMRSEKRKQFIARQTARMEGAIIPPTPLHELGAGTAQVHRPEPPLAFAQPLAPLSKQKSKVQFGLLSITKQLEREQALKLILLAFKRVIANEKRAIQGGAGIAQQKLLVRLVTRFGLDSNAELEDLLTTFIVAEQKSRNELALMWIAELYAQFQGYSLNQRSTFLTDSSLEMRRYERYDSVLCTLLRTLFERGEHKETLFHKILLEAPLLTTQSLTWLRAACLDSVFGAFGMATLRELILTRTRQRNELLCLLLEFSYSERSDVRTQSVETAKELYQIPYVRSDVREYLVCTIEYCLRPSPPPQICPNLAEGVVPQWDDATIRSALHLFLSILPIDHSLVHNLAAVYAKASNDIKRVTLRAIESAIKGMGGSSEHLLKMIENCPDGADTLVARIVHLLTERNPPTQELVDRVSALYDQGRTDVRSLIPVVNGLDKEQILRILPKFALNAVNQKSVRSLFAKILLSKSIKTGQHPMTASELLIAMHRIQTSTLEESELLMQNIDILLSQLTAAKDSIASAIDVLLDDDVFPTKLLHTVARTHEAYPALSGFISNVIQKVVQKRPWSKDNSIWPHFVRCAISTAPHSFLAILTSLSKDDFVNFVKEANRDGKRIEAVLRDYIPTLSAHQQKKIDRGIRDVITLSEVASDNKENKL